MQTNTFVRIGKHQKIYLAISKNQQSRANFHDGKNAYVKNHKFPGYS